MPHWIHGDVAGIEPPRIVRDSDRDRVGCLHMFRAVSSRTIAVVDIRFERRKSKHALRVHQSLEVCRPKLAPRKNNTADSH